MQATQIARQVFGNTNSPTLVLDGTDYDYQVVEGLDVTIENDQPMILVDFNAVISFSVNPGIVRFAMNVDNAVDSSQVIEITSTATAAVMFAGFFALTIGPGSHRYRLTMSCDNAATATLTAKQRRMRVQGMIGLT